MAFLMKSGHLAFFKNSNTRPFGLFNIKQGHVGLSYIKATWPFLYIRRPFGLFIYMSGPLGHIHITEPFHPFLLIKKAIAFLLYVLTRKCSNQVGKAEHIYSLNLFPFTFKISYKFHHQSSHIILC